MKIKISCNECKKTVEILKESYARYIRRHKDQGCYICKSCTSKRNANGKLISEKLKDKWKDPNYRDKIVESLKSRQFRDELRNLIKDANENIDEDIFDVGDLNKEKDD